MSDLGLVTEQKKVAPAGAFRHVRAFVSDYYGFYNLVVYLVLILPIAWLAHQADKLFGTRSVDGVIKFCEWF